MICQVPFNGKNTQETMDVPHYQKILDFINLCTWAAKMSNPEPKKPFIPNNKETGAKTIYYPPD